VPAVRFKKPDSFAFSRASKKNCYITIPIKIILISLLSPVSIAPRLEAARENQHHAQDGACSFPFAAAGLAISQKIKP
jgi:hypothetical protein